MNMLKTPAFEFDIDFKTGKAQPVPILRLHLRSGMVMRAWFGPDGLLVVMPKQCKDNGDIVWLSGDNFMFNIGATDEPKDEGEKDG